MGVFLRVKIENMSVVVIGLLFNVCVISWLVFDLIRSTRQARRFIKKMDAFTAELERLRSEFGDKTYNEIKQQLKSER